MATLFIVKTQKSTVKVFVLLVTQEVIILKNNLGIAKPIPPSTVVITLVLDLFLKEFDSDKKIMRVLPLRTKKTTAEKQGNLLFRN